MNAELNRVEENTAAEARAMGSALDKVTALLETEKGRNHIVAKRPGIAGGANGDLKGIFDPNGVEGGKKDQPQSSHSGGQR